MKNYSHIEALLERYYDAQTSEAEEQRLKDFFLHEEVPAHLRPEKEMFLQLQATDVPEGLEERLSQSIDRWVKKHRTLRLQWIGSIAACLLLLFGTGWYLQEDTSRKDTCSTPEEAYAETQKALVMFSTALNKGMERMDALHKTTERVEKIFKINQPLNDTEL